MHQNPTADRFFARQTESHQRLLEWARELIFKALPQVKEVMKYGVPMYEYLGILCYLNVRKKKIVELAFMRGVELMPVCPDLISGDRTQIAGIQLKEINEVTELAIFHTLFEAAKWQETRSLRKKTKAVHR